MSVESLRRVLTKIKGTAREMRKDKHAKRVAKPKEEPKADPSTVDKVRELLSKG
jgi:hypothetical protein